MLPRPAILEPFHISPTLSQCTDQLQIEGPILTDFNWRKSEPKKSFKIISMRACPDSPCQTQSPFDRIKPRILVELNAKRRYQEFSRSMEEDTSGPLGQARQESLATQQGWKLRYDNAVASEKKKHRLKKNCTKLINFLIRLREMQLTVDEWLNNIVVPLKSYQMEKSKEFFVQIRLSNMSNLREMLHQSRFFIFQIDSIGKTPLHRACLNNDEELVNLFLRHVPDVNKRCFKGLSPLSEAINNDNIQIARLLLLNRAKPWFDGNGSYKNLYRSGPMGSLVEKAKHFWMSLVILPLSKKDKEWETRINEVL